MLGYLLLVVMGLVSVIGTEVLSMGALINAPEDVNLTHVFFISLVLPTIIMISVLNALILWKVFVPRRWRGIATFTVSYALGYVAALTSVGRNPIGDVATYVVMVAIIAPVVLGTFDRVFWSDART